MDREELYTFVTGLLDGNEIDLDLFYTFLETAQMRVEGLRPWMQLRGEDTSLTVSPGNTYTTSKDLPTDFRRWYARYSVAFTDSQGQLAGNPLEVPIAMKVNYQQNNNKFYCNYGTRKIFFCGQPSQALTAHLFYIRKGTLVSSAEGQTWEFPSEYSKVLGFLVAVFYKLGVDYDIVNNEQGNANAAAAAGILSTMSEWDDELQLSSVQGMDYGSGQGWTSTPSGGRMGPDLI